MMKDAVALLLTLRLTEDLQSHPAPRATGTYQRLLFQYLYFCPSKSSTFVPAMLKEGVAIDPPPPPPESYWNSFLVNERSKMLCVSYLDV
jgi:hypothetical protein